MKESCSRCQWKKEGEPGLYIEINREELFGPYCNNCFEFVFAGIRNLANEVKSTTILTYKIQRKEGE